MAYSLDGVTQQIKYNTVFDFTSQPITVSAWVLPNVVTGLSYFTNVETSSNDIGCIFFQSTGDLQYSRFFGLTAKSLRASLGAVVTTSAYQHILVTDDNTLDSVNIHLYRNGTEATSYDFQSSGTGAVFSFTGQVILGGRSKDTLRQYNGNMTQLGVWNRVLTTPEIANLSAGYSPWYIKSGLVYAAPLTSHVFDVRSGENGTFVGTPGVTQDPNALIYYDTGYPGLIV